MAYVGHLAREPPPTQPNLKERLAGEGAALGARRSGANIRVLWVWFVAQDKNFDLVARGGQSTPLGVG